MKGRKTAAEGNRRKKVQQKLFNYFENQKKAEEDFCQTFEEYLSSNDLNSSFKNLNLYINANMMVDVKKNIVLTDGVYVLLQGSVTYIWTKNRHDRNRKDHLFSLAKTGVFSNLTQGFSERNTFLTNGYSILINSHFAVLQSQNGNIHTNQDCVVLEIPQKVCDISCFYELKAQKQEVFLKAKLPGFWNYQIEPLISLNCNLHHAFKIKNLTFRSRFDVCTLGVIKKGTAIYKPNKSQGIIQFTKYCLLLPGFQYEVSSSQVQIIEVDRNPTIIFKKPIIFAKFTEQLTSRSLLCQENCHKQQVKKYCRRINNSISVHKSKPSASFIREQKRKKKDCQLFSKQNQQFWIVSTQLCKQNLINLKIMKNKVYALTEKRNRIPQILFNVSKNKNKNNTLYNNSEQQNYTDPGQSYNKNNRQNSNKLIQRYENYAKDIYQQFRKCQAAKIKENI